MRVTLLHALLLAFLCIRPLQVLPGTRVTLYEISPRSENLVRRLLISTSVLTGVSPSQCLARYNSPRPWPFHNNK